MDFTKIFEKQITKIINGEVKTGHNNSLPLEAHKDVAIYIKKIMAEICSEENLDLNDFQIITENEKNEGDTKVKTMTGFHRADIKIISKKKNKPAIIEYQAVKSSYIKNKSNYGNNYFAESYSYAKNEIHILQIIQIPTILTEHLEFFNEYKQELINYINYKKLPDEEKKKIKKVSKPKKMDVTFVNQDSLDVFEIYHFELKSLFKDLVETLIITIDYDYEINNTKLSNFKNFKNGKVTDFLKDCNDNYYKKIKNWLKYFMI
jgi:hypothetical protein